MNSHNVKRFYLSAILGTLMAKFSKVAVSFVDGMTLKVTGKKEDVISAFTFFVSNYTPTMTGENGIEKTPSYFTITRNMVFTVDGNTRKGSENTASVRDRQRIGSKGSKNYRYNPNGLTIHGIDVKDTDGKVNTTWTVKDRTGKTLTTCRVLNAEAWPFCENYVSK